MHAASPFIRDFTDPQKELVEPAVHGTKNVLSAVAKHKDTVKTTVVCIVIDMKKFLCAAGVRNMPITSAFFAGHQQLCLCS